MIASLPTLDELPRHPASHVKNRWGDVVRQVRESGSVAVTSHSTVEMVLVETGTYRKLVEDVRSLQAKEQALLDDLTRSFEARLVTLQAPDAAQRVDELFEARGRLKSAVRAGATF